MKRNLRILDRVQVKSPCTEDWNEMVGNDEVRFCSHCSQHVHNLSAMTRREAEALVLKSNGNLCIRYLRRPEDQQIVTLPDWMDRPALRRIVLPVAAGVIAVVLNTPPSLAQKAEGGAKIQSQMVKRVNYIDGTLVNQLGDPVPGATIRCTSLQTHKTVTMTSDGRGAFQFFALGEGNYQLEIESDGYISRKLDFEVFTGKTPLDLLLTSRSTEEVIGLSAGTVVAKGDQSCKLPKKSTIARRQARITLPTPVNLVAQSENREVTLISTTTEPVMAQTLNNKILIDVPELLKTWTHGPIRDLEGQPIVCGTVLNAEEVKIGGAVVELVNQNSGHNQCQNTNQEGGFRFENVEAGIYLLKVTAKGYIPWEKSEVKLNTGQGKQINPGLSVQLITMGLTANISDDLLNTSSMRALHPKLEGTEAEVLQHLEKGNTSAVLPLLKQGIEPDARNEFGETALMLVGNSQRVAKYLVRYGADVNARNQVGTTPLMYAMLQEKTFIPKLLIAGGADVNAADQWGRTALMIAAFEGKTRFIKLLIKAGAEIEVKDRFGKTALDYASDANQSGVVKLLKAAEAKQATTH